MCIYNLSQSSHMLTKRLVRLDVSLIFKDLMMLRLRGFLVVQWLRL